VPGGVKRNIGRADVLQICVRHVSNCHRERSAAKSKDLAVLLS
jgi:hypothetical protein